jgi:hypothetical protein
MPTSGDYLDCYVTNSTGTFTSSKIITCAVLSSSSSEPIVTIVSVSVTKISDETGKNACNVTFSFDQDIVEYTVNVLGTSHDSGTVADSAVSNVTANTEITAEIDYTELYQEGNDQVNIYGKNASGTWSSYMQS